MEFFERIHENMPLFADSLNETGSSPVSGIVHRHPDRTPFTVTRCCTAYCRYCTRSHFVGKLGQFSKGIWDRAIAYLEAHGEIRNVVISGGDPLTLPDDKLIYFRDLQQPG